MSIVSASKLSLTSANTKNGDGGGSAIKLRLLPAGCSTTPITTQVTPSGLFENRFSKLADSVKNLNDKFTLASFLLLKDPRNPNK